MSDTQTSDPEWTKLYDIYCDIPNERRGPVANYYYKNYRRTNCVEAMHKALVLYGWLTPLEMTGAEEYEEIMKGAGIWASIQSD